MTVSLARPVTPVGIAAELLERGGPDDVARAREILAGLDAYAAAMTTPASAALVELEGRTRTVPWEDGLEQEMLSGHVEGAFLRMLVAITRAQSVLEVGMFTGYSALAMAEALPATGRLVACELDERAVAVAREAFAGSPAGGLVDVRLGPALETLHHLAADGERFDLVFVDADKAGYAAYLDALLDLDLLAEAGVVCVDNTLMQGQPWAGGRTANGEAVAAFNERLAADPRVEQVLLPIRDGVTLVRRVA